MSQVEEDDSRPYTDHDLEEAIRRVNAGEINLKEAENYYGISPRTIHRQRAIQNMRAQLNPEKAKKLKAAGSSTAKKDITVLRKPVEISCSSIGDIVSLLNEGTEEVKQLLNHECDLIYECKVCKSLFRSLLNFISHKRIYCCDMYSVAHTQSNENGDSSVATDSVKVEENLKAKDNLKEFTSRPFRITCRKDLTTVLKRITSLSSEFVSTEPILHLQSMENATVALQQIIKPNKPVNESVADKSSPDSNAKNENATVIPQVEAKKETVAKPEEKTTVLVKPMTIAEKRFKCPLCPSNYATKKSVLRHLKTAHHKSVEQLERLKSRVQLFFVKKKNVLVTKKSVTPSASKQSTVTATSATSAQAKSPVTTSPSGSSNETTVSPTSSTKNDQNLEKADREKECSLCGRHFANRSSYVSHIRGCRKNTSSDGDTDSASADSSSPLVPIVSLTPIATPAQGPKNANEGNHTTRKLTSVASQSKKVGLPLGPSTSSSSSKKIGIQVRMNYCKDGINPSSSINGTSTGCTTPSGQSLASSENSRRSSIISVTRDEKSNIAKADLLNGHNTRSKLANILKSLLDKHGVKDENEDPKNADTVTKVEKREVSIYCQDCKTTYALNDYKWNSENGTPRVYKCALKDCDFRSGIKSELLPHLSAQHSVLPENELAEVDSIFIAESSGVPTGSGKCCCHKGLSGERSLDRRKRDVSAESSSAVSSQNANPSKRKIITDCSSKPVKRKAVVGSKKKRALSGVDGKTENSSGSTDTSERDVTKHQSLNSDEKPEDGQVSKKLVSKPRIRTKKLTLADTGLSSIKVPNGLESSSEQSQSASTRAVKKQNLLLNETKIPSKLPNINTLMDSSPYSPDMDLDPATMTEENLKKSVMTIIFGKDMSDENVDTNIDDIREKSPDSSSTSSDSGKEKRYGLRAVKPACLAANKAVVTSSLTESKDDKVMKIQVPNRVKNAPR